jgi:hypothetical protein
MNAAPDLIPFVLSGEVLTWDPVNRWLVRVSLGAGSRLPPSPRPEPVGAGHFEQCPERSGAGTQCPRLVVEQMGTRRRPRRRSPCRRPVATSPWTA